jgi:hypothetical protein
MRTWRTAVVGLALLLSPLLVACGDDAPAGGLGGGPTPPGGGGAAIGNSCDLLTRDQAAAAAGNAVQEGKLLGIVCIWEPEDIDNDANVQVSADYVPALGGDPAQMCQASLAGIPGAEPFDGIAGDAYWDFQAGGISNTGSLHVCTDRGFVDTSAIGGRPEAELQSIAVSLANTALARIGAG